MSSLASRIPQWFRDAYTRCSREHDHAVHLAAFEREPLEIVEPAYRACWQQITKGTIFVTEERVFEWLYEDICKNDETPMLREFRACIEREKAKRRERDDQSATSNPN